METLLGWLTEHADNAHYFLFGLIILTGFSLPISEDLLLIVGGVLASTVIPEKTLHLFFAVFIGSCISDSIAYWIGRALGEKLYSIPWFSRILCERKKQWISKFYKKYGFFALAMGRCIPFGIRNAIFMTAGASSMSFPLFLLSDVSSCFLFSLLLFFLSFLFGKNYATLYSLIHKISIMFLLVFVALICFSIFYARAKKKKRARESGI